VSSPRLVIAGTGSGVGKTTVATGLLAALSRRGARATGFKVGPDFIDPSYHALATGRPGRNLDAFLSGKDLIAPLFLHGARDAEVAVIEGVMGLYDGKAGGGELASTAQVAKLLRAPVVLVVDAAAIARSAAAVVHGFASFDPWVRVAGVILNRVGSARHEEMLREALAPLEIPVLGVLARRPELATPERHLGLVPVAERGAEARRAVDTMAAAVAEHCDLAALGALARRAGRLLARPWDPAEALAAIDAALAPGAARIAVAGGPAFSFRYQENLELLRASGAELAAFDPLRDPALPEGSGALYLGGGFPEEHAAALSANAPLRAQVAAFARTGRPVVAECGGLLYLGRELDGAPMCGAIDAAASLTPRLRLGYRDAVAASGSALWAAGERVAGHEFHYSTVQPVAGPSPAWRLPEGRGERLEGFVAGGVHASYLHTHWAATPQAAARLAAAAGRQPASTLTGAAA
jgi:cobyrinic acid a,c-diamide synthase